MCIVVVFVNVMHIKLARIKSFEPASVTLRVFCVPVFVLGYIQ